MLTTLHTHSGEH